MSGFTEARQAALEAVATGRVRHENAPRGRWSIARQHGTLRPQPYRWLLTEGYIVLGVRERWFTPASLSERGRERLRETAPDEDVAS